MKSPQKLKSKEEIAHSPSVKIKGKQKTQSSSRIEESEEKKDFENNDEIKKSEILQDLQTSLTPNNFNNQNIDLERINNTISFVFFFFGIKIL